MGDNTYNGLDGALQISLRRMPLRRERGGDSSPLVRPLWKLYYGRVSRNRIIFLTVVVAI